MPHYCEHFFLPIFCILSCMDKITKSDKILVLLKLFERQASYTINQLASRLHCEERSVYRSVALLRDHGFNVKNQDGHYYMPEYSGQIHTNFSAYELALLREWVDKSALSTTSQAQLIDKLGIANTHESDRFAVVKMGGDNLTALYNAITQQKCVLLRNYLSGSDKPITDRMVEPYKLANESSYCMCYELDSDTCKLFKVDRAEAVLPVSESWSHKHLHRMLPMDVFRMCGHEQIQLSVTMDVFARNLLLDEYPQAVSYLQPLSPERFRLSCTLNRYEGAMRFLISVIGHIHIEQPTELILLLQNKTKEMQVALDAMVHNVK